jgi:protein gp37
MMAQTKIEWCHVVDNILVVEGGGWWCRKISPGCDFCYAEEINQNPFFGGNRLPYSGDAPTLRFREEIVDAWARQRKPKRHFVASMTDVFGEWVPRWMIFRMLDGMVAAPGQTFQVLTKRPQIALREIRAYLQERPFSILPKNIWMGCTVENQEWANRRREAFKNIPAQVKFVSYEPALGPVDWAGWEFIDQIISGGESGDQARPAHPGWHRGARDWCVKNGKAYFFKQHGEWKPIGEMPEPEYGALYRSNRIAKEDEDQGSIDELYGRTCKVEETAIAYDGTLGFDLAFWHEHGGGMHVFKVGKKRAGRLLDGREHNGMPVIQ